MWNWRTVIIVPEAAKAAAEHAARQINSTGSGYTGDAFSLPLSPDGSDPVTHWGVYTSATDAMVAAMSAALPNIDAMYWRHDIEGRLVASNVTQPEGQAWGAMESFAAAGLSLVQETMP